MNASAHPASAAQPWPDAQYTGTLIAPAQCRMRAVDTDGHMAPVLVLDLELDTALRTRMRVEQPFPADAHAACEAAAKRHRVGSQVSIQAPLAGLRLVATQTRHVHVLAASSSTTPNPTEEHAR